MEAIPLVEPKDYAAYYSPVEQLEKTIYLIIKYYLPKSQLSLSLILAV
jgi:hypothetical protein